MGYAALENGVGLEPRPRQPNQPLDPVVRLPVGPPLDVLEPPAWLCRLESPEVGWDCGDAAAA
jgi:hypothetical protein